MSNLSKIESKTDVKETLAECLELSENLDGVIILGLYKNGGQLIRSSTMSAFEKSFLCSFLNAYMTNWFELDGD